MAFTSLIAFIFEFIFNEISITGGYKNYFETVIK